MAEKWLKRKQEKFHLTCIEKAQQALILRNEGKSLLQTQILIAPCLIGGVLSFVCLSPSAPFVT